MALPTFRYHTSLVTLALLAAPLASAQGLKPVGSTEASTSHFKLMPPPETQKLREAYKRAYDDWEKNADRDLIRDLQALPPEQILPRIEAEKKRTHDMVEAKEKYYEALQKEYRKIYDQMAGINAAGPDIEQHKAVAQQEMDALFEQRKQIEEEIKSAKDALIRTQLVKQRDSLQRAEDALQKDRLALDRIKQNSADLQKVRAEALDSQNAVIQVAQSMAENSGQLREHYDAYYAALAKAASNRPKISPPPPPPPPPPVKVDPVPPPVKASIDTASAPVAPRAAALMLGGEWAFFSTDDPAVPARLGLSLKDSGKMIEGSVTVLQPPKEWGLGSKAACQFSGPKSFKPLLGGYSFVCGTLGEVQLVPSDERVIEVVWHGTNGKRVFRFDQPLNRVSAP